MISKAEVIQQPRAAEDEESSPMDEFAFQSFYRSSAPKLRAYIYRACGKADLADDILQESFYRFLRSKLSGLTELQLKAYLYRTASSLVADHFRKLKREQRWSWDVVRNDTKLSDSELEHDVAQAFRQLKSNEQLLLWLAYVEGYNHREIAGALRLREKSVRVLLFRARKKLERRVKREGI